MKTVFSLTAHASWPGQLAESFFLLGAKRVATVTHNGGSYLCVPQDWLVYVKVEYVISVLKKW